MSFAFASPAIRTPNALDAMPVSNRTDTELSARITARICHDLISPIGAVDNGIELIGAMGTAPSSSDLAMIAESTRVASLKIRLFRLAFGPVTGSDLDLAELRTLVEGALGRPRLSFRWATPAGALPRPDAKALILLIMCCDSAMARGGTLEIGVTPSGFRLHAQTDRPRIDAEVWAILDGLDDALPAPGQIHFALARIMAEEQNIQLSVHHDETSLELIARQG